MGECSLDLSDDIREVGTPSPVFGVSRIKHAPLFAQLELDQPSILVAPARDER